MKQWKNGDYKNKIASLKKKPFKLVLILVFILILLVFLLESCSRYRPLPPGQHIYFHEPFDTSISEWQHLDAKWQESLDKHTGIASLAKKQYAAPYLAKVLTLEQSPPNDYVFHMKAHVTSFTDQALVLGTLILPTGQITIIVNREGYLGIAHELFQAPVYSKNPLDRMKMKEWTDVYVHVSLDDKKITLYKDKSKVMTTTYKSTLSPVQEIWLGAIWLNGDGRYGAPLEVSYDSVTLGDKETLPRLSFVQYTYNIFKRIWGEIFNVVS